MTQRTLRLSAAAFLMVVSVVAGDDRIWRTVESRSDYAAKYAIIIGINDYAQSEGFGQLQNAGNDAREFRKLLVEEFGYNDERILYLTDSKDEPKAIVDGPPTRDAIQNAFEKWLPGRPGLGPDDSILFFFAGHGLRDGEAGEAYIAGVNSRARDPKGTCVRVGWIRDRLGDKKAMPCRHKLVLLDCCFSGGLFMFSQPLVARPSPAAVPEKPGKPDDPIPGPPQATRGAGAGARQGGDEISYYLGGEGFVGMTAGLGDQPVADGAGRDKHSFFTRELLRAMRERANSRRKDHVFTFTELAAQARQRVTVEILKLNPLLDQIPMAGRIEAGEGDFVFHQSIDREVPWERAERDARLAESRRLAVLSDEVRPERLDLAMLLAVEAAKQEDTPEARGSLQRALDARPEVVRFLHVPEGDVRSVAFGPEGKIAAGHGPLSVVGSVGGVVLFDARGKRLRPMPLEVEGGVLSVAFGPDGKIAAGYSSGRGGVVIFDARGERLRPTPLEIKEGGVSRVAFGPDGKIAAGCNLGGVGGLVLFDALGQRLQPVPLKLKEGDVRSLAFGPDGKIAVGYGGRGGGGVVLFNLRGERLRPAPLEVKEGGVSGLAFGPDGKIAAAYYGGSHVDGVVLFDAHGERLRAAPLEVKEGVITSVAFGPGAQIAAGYYVQGRNVGGVGVAGGGVVLFDARGERVRPAPLEVKQVSVLSVAFGPDGKIAAGYGGGGRGGVVLFDPQGERLRAGSLVIREGPIQSLAFGPDRQIAVAYVARSGGGAVVFDGRGERLRPAPLEVKEGEISSLAFGADGKIAVGYRVGGGGGVVVFDSRGERLRPAPLEVKEGYLTSLAFNPDGLLAAGYGVYDERGGIVFFDARGERLRPTPLEVRENPVRTLAFGPDGLLAAGYFGRRPSGVVLFDARGERLRSAMLLWGQFRSLAFGPEGKIAGGYSGSVSSGVELFGARGERLRPAPMEVKEGDVSSVAFGPDGHVAAGYQVGRGGGGVVLFDASGERLRPVPLGIREGSVRSVAFGPDGLLAAGYAGLDGLSPIGGVVLFDADPASWLRKAGQVANRNLTRAEWRQYFPNTPYRRTLDNLPAPPEEAPNPGPRGRD